MVTHASKSDSPRPPHERCPLVLAALGNDEADQRVAAMALQATPWLTAARTATSVRAEREAS